VAAAEDEADQGEDAAGVAEEPPEVVAEEGGVREEGVAEVRDDKKDFFVFRSSVLPEPVCVYIVQN
jgi:hypothetical protein